MKIVVQRVLGGEVQSDGNTLGSISKGLLLLVGIHGEDSKLTVEWCCEKISGMRIFDDEEGKMNLSVEDVKGELLVVPQFTLCGDAEKGNRPSFTSAAPPEKAEELFDYMVSYFRRNTPQPVSTGEFGAYMEVELVNDGPVTIILSR